MDAMCFIAISILRNKNWLNDKVRLQIVACITITHIMVQIIDTYIFLVMEEANKKADTSLFYTALTSFGCRNIYNLIKVHDCKIKF